uniref:BACK domain-containing protein n=1 Tax=Heterorhabditis bacteriophora TaxID=37862 RepID=A0A1I7WPP0_HETBA
MIDLGVGDDPIVGNKDDVSQIAGSSSGTITTPLYHNVVVNGTRIHSRQQEVQMVDIDVATLDALINFCYTGEIRITDVNVQSILPAACLLQLNEVQEVCCEFLKKQLDPSNCLGIRAFADTHACRELMRSADKYTLQNFQDVVGTEEFLLLPPNQLIELISSEELNVRSEEQVFAAVIQWIRYDLAVRKQYLSRVSSDLFYVNIIILISLVGGWCSGDAIASVERLDPGKAIPVWQCVAPMSKRRCGVGVAVVDDLLYAVGGHDGQTYLNSIERYFSESFQCILFKFSHHSFYFYF